MLPVALPSRFAAATAPSMYTSEQPRSSSVVIVVLARNWSTTIRTAGPATRASRGTSATSISMGG